MSSDETTSGRWTGIVPLRGFEWTWGGSTGSNHINVFETAETAGTGSYSGEFGRQPGAPHTITTDGLLGLDLLYRWVMARRSLGERPICQFNHVSLGSHLNNFVIPNQKLPRIGQADLDDAFCLLEMAVSDALVYAWYPLQVGQVYYELALMQGWHVGPTLGSDNFGTPDREMATGLWVKSDDWDSGDAARRKEAVVGALRARRTFVSEDRDLTVRLEARPEGSATWRWMGDTISTDGNVYVRLVAEDPHSEGGLLKGHDYFETIELRSPKGVMGHVWREGDRQDEARMNGLRFDNTDRPWVITPQDRYGAMGPFWVYAKIRQQGTGIYFEHLAYTAPIWIEPATPDTPRPEPPEGLTPPPAYATAPELAVLVADDAAPPVGNAPAIAIYVGEDTGSAAEEPAAVTSSGLSAPALSVFMEEDAWSAASSPLAAMGGGLVAPALTVLRDDTVPFPELSLNLTSLPVTTQVSEDVRNGDLTGDSSVTVADVLKAIRITLRLVPAESGDLRAADFDNDGRIAIGDVLALLRMVLGLT